jgi:hypothetical protein
MQQQEIPGVGSTPIPPIDRPPRAPKPACRTHRSAIVFYAVCVHVVDGAAPWLSWVRPTDEPDDLGEILCAACMETPPGVSIIDDLRLVCASCAATSFWTPGRSSRRRTGAAGGDEGRARDL